MCSSDLLRVNALEENLQQLRTEQRTVRENQKAFAGVFRSPDPIRVLHRGDPEQPKESAPPRIPSFFDPAEESKEGNVGANITESDRRIALARWITNPTNPLTARVIANRLWQGHFGTGIVATPNDFGMNGLQPTHPELLD